MRARGCFWLKTPPLDNIICRWAHTTNTSFGIKITVGCFWLTTKLATFIPQFLTHLEDCPIYRGLDHFGVMIAIFLIPIIVFTVKYKIDIYTNSLYFIGISVAIVIFCYFWIYFKNIEWLKNIIQEKSKKFYKEWLRYQLSRTH